MGDDWAGKASLVVSAAALAVAFLWPRDSKVTVDVKQPAVTAAAVDHTAQLNRIEHQLTATAAAAATTTTTTTTTGGSGGTPASVAAADAAAKKLEAELRQALAAAEVAAKESATKLATAEGQLATATAAASKLADAQQEIEKLKKAAADAAAAAAAAATAVVPKKEDGSAPLGRFLRSPLGWGHNPHAPRGHNFGEVVVASNATVAYAEDPLELTWTITHNDALDFTSGLSAAVGFFDCKVGFDYKRFNDTKQNGEFKQLSRSWFNADAVFSAVSPNTQYPYCTRTFKEQCETLSGRSLLEVYGTHVVTEARRYQVNATVASKQHSDAKAGADANFKGVGGGKLGLTKNNDDNADDKRVDGLGERATMWESIEPLIVKFAPTETVRAWREALAIDRLRLMKKEGIVRFNGFKANTKHDFLNDPKRVTLVKLAGFVNWSGARPQGVYFVVVPDKAMVKALKDGEKPAKNQTGWYAYAITTLPPFSAASAAPTTAPETVTLMAPTRFDTRIPAKGTMTIGELLFELASKHVHTDMSNVVDYPLFDPAEGAVA